MNNFNYLYSATKPLENAATGCFRRLIWKRLATSVLVGACVLVAGFSTRAQAQFQGLFRITDGSFANHIEYHTIDLPPGKELVLADIGGSGQDHLLLLHRRQSLARERRVRLHVSRPGSGSVLG